MGIMPERKVTVTTPDGKKAEGLEVPVTESVERWCDLTLEDGTILKIKPVVESTVRLIDQFDPDGNPIYLIRSGFATVIASIPDGLKKKGN